jgi:hypothetical protein
MNEPNPKTSTLVLNDLQWIFPRPARVTASAELGFAAATG